MSSSFALLREYEHKLKDLVRSKFTEARDTNDLEGIERYRMRGGRGGQK